MVPLTPKLLRKLVQESLHNWFKKEDWVRITSDGSIAGPCGTSKNKKNPDRCLPRAKANSMTKAERAATARKKKKAGAKGKTVVPNTKKGRVTKGYTKEDLRNYIAGVVAENVEKDINQLKKLSNRKERYNYIKNFSKEKLIKIADELYLDYEEYDDIEDKVLNSLDESKLDEKKKAKKDDRCTRIAKRKYDTWPSAYASGAVVRCRRGEIWKNES